MPLPCSSHARRASASLPPTEAAIAPSPPRDPRTADALAGQNAATRATCRTGATTSSPSRRRARNWVDGVAGRLAQGAWPRSGRRRSRPIRCSRLELMGDDVVETSILSSRLAQVIQDKANFELNDLRLRIQHLEGTSELDAKDVLRPEALAKVLVEQWLAAGLSRALWTKVQDVDAARCDRGGRRGLQGCQRLPDRQGRDARDRPQELRAAHRRCRDSGADAARRQLGQRRRRRDPVGAGRARARMAVGAPPGSFAPRPSASARAADARRRRRRGTDRRLAAGRWRGSGRRACC